MSETFDHEVSHVLLRQAVSPEVALPRWFVEGIAIWQAGEGVLERLGYAQAAAVTDNLIPFEQLDTHFPKGNAGVRLAYAESALFVSWLQRRYGPSHLSQLVAKLRRASSFEQAFLAVFHEPVAVLSQRWADELDSSTSFILFFRDGTIFWVLMVFLFLYAAFVKRARRRRAIEAMDDVEAAEDALAELELAQKAGRPPTVH